MTCVMVSLFNFLPMGTIEYISPPLGHLLKIDFFQHPGTEVRTTATTTSTYVKELKGSGCGSVGRVAAVWIQSSANFILPIYCQPHWKDEKKKRPGLAQFLLKKELNLFSSPFSDKEFRSHPPTRSLFFEFSLSSSLSLFIDGISIYLGR